MHLPSAWEQSFDAGFGETSPETVTELVRFLQTAAEGHAGALGFSVEALQERGLTWVLSRFRMLIKEYPGKGERIVVRTWPTGVERLFAGREYRISSSHRKELARADSLWMMMQLERRRPARLPADFQEKVPFRPRINFEHPIEKLEISEPPAVATELEVGPEDLDFNGHVTHTRYLDWILKTVPEVVVHQQELAELVVEFRQETSAGVHLTARCTAAQPKTDNTTHFEHVLQESDSGQIFTLARTTWKAST